MSLLASQTHQHHGHLTNFWCFCGLPHWPWCFFPGLFTLFPTHTDPDRRGCGPGVPALWCAVHQRRPRSRGLLLLNRCGWQLWGGAILWRPILEQICTWLSLQTDYTIRPSWTPLCRGVNNWHSNPEKFGRLIGCAPGHQVTPHLRTFFCAGGWGD